MNNRRKLVLALGAGALTASFGSFPQQQNKVWRIGYLQGSTREAQTYLIQAFEGGLREKGYTLGRDLVIGIPCALAPT